MSRIPAVCWVVGDITRIENLPPMTRDLPAGPTPHPGPSACERQGGTMGWQCYLFFVMSDKNSRGLIPLPRSFAACGPLSHILIAAGWIGLLNCVIAPLLVRSSRRASCSPVSHGWKQVYCLLQTFCLPMTLQPQTGGLSLSSVVSKLSALYFLLCLGGGLAEGSSGSISSAHSSISPSLSG